MEMVGWSSARTEPTQLTRLLCNLRPQCQVTRSFAVLDQGPAAHKQQRTNLSVTQQDSEEDQGQGTKQEPGVGKDALFRGS